MSENKLVSVITGTCDRHELLGETIDNVRKQTYSPIEHCIASESKHGPRDPLLYEMIQKEKMYVRVPTRFAETGRHWSSFLSASLSAVPFQMAQWMARGDYLMWLADDERMEPDHIEKLVRLLESTKSDFVYSKCLLWFVDGLADASPPFVIGTDPPRLGQITNALYRAELIDYKGFETHVGSATDWNQIDYWMGAGARWAMLDEVTISHRIDKMGEGPEFRVNRQPLYGHDNES